MSGICRGWMYFQICSDRQCAGAEGTDQECADAFFVSLEDLCKTIEIPTLEAYGINREAFFEKMDKMADDALASGSPGNTIKEVTKEDILHIYKKLWEA